MVASSLGWFVSFKFTVLSVDFSGSIRWTVTRSVMNDAYKKMYVLANAQSKPSESHFLKLVIFSIVALHHIAGWDCFSCQGL